MFHDTLEALEATFESDEKTLSEAGYDLQIVRRLTGFIEAVAARGGRSVEVQWLHDSAFRFFPLMRHPIFGLVLHPFDLATNKLLALVGRSEARDWVDILSCHQKISPLGLLAFAACGKDEGWNPDLILNEAARTTRYSRPEIEALDWSGPIPDFIELKTQWRAALQDARESLNLLPPQFLGCAALDGSGTPFLGSNLELRAALERDELRFHVGTIGGVWPTIGDAV